MVKLLIIEDDIQLNTALKIYFEKIQYLVFQAFNCKEARQMIRNEPDIMIVDIGLPDGSGIDFCKNVLQNRKIPVIFLTARDEERDIIDGYEAGCEEYVTKPVSPKILLKKLEVILKRKSDSERVLIYQEIKIDFEKRRVWIQNNEMKLTSKEWKILEILSKNRGKIITKEMLLEQIWDIEGNYVEEHAIAVVINRLRKKIEKDIKHPVYIKNIFGIGYTFGD